MWDLIVSIPDHCLSFYYVYKGRISIDTEYRLNDFLTGPAVIAPIPIYV